MTLSNHYRFRLSKLIRGVDEHNPIYEFPQEAQFSAGAGYYSLFVDDGTASKEVLIYIPYKEYLVPALRKTYDIISTYYPDGMMLYRPPQMVLWIEKGNGGSYYSVTPEPVVEWPSDLPPIGVLGVGHVIVDKELEPRIMALFDLLPGGRVFRDEGVEYLIIARPLLPNESPSIQLGD